MYDRGQSKSGEEWRYNSKTILLPKLNYKLQTHTHTQFYWAPAQRTWVIDSDISADLAVYYLVAES